MPFPYGTRAYSQFKSREVTITDSDGAQTNALISPAIPAGAKLVVHDLYCAAEGGNSQPTAVRVGFGATTLPAASASGVEGILLSHPDLPAGSGLFGISGVGAPGEELRLTCEDPLGGSITITYLYNIEPA